MRFHFRVLVNPNADCQTPYRTAAVEVIGGNGDRLRRLWRHFRVEQLHEPCGLYIKTLPCAPLACPLVALILTVWAISQMIAQFPACRKGILVGSHYLGVAAAP